MDPRSLYEGHERIPSQTVGDAGQEQESGEVGAGGGEEQQEASGKRKRQDGFFPKPPEGTCPANTLTLNFWPRTVRAKCVSL